MEKLCEKIKRLRTDMGYSQADFSRKVGISPQFMCNIEYGCRLPSTKTLNAIAQAFNMTAMELLADVIIYVWDRAWQLVPHDDYMKYVLEE